MSRRARAIRLAIAVALYWLALAVMTFGRQGF
jgi:hypothetical protein